MSATASTDVARVALAAHEAGLFAWPPKEDGSKQPDTEYVPRDRLIALLGEEEALRRLDGKPGVYTWGHRQHERPTRAELERMYSRGRAGVGFVCGPISNNLELLEFDEFETYGAFKAAADGLGLGDLVERVEAGYSSRTPGDGVHWLMYSSA